MPCKMRTPAAKAVARAGVLLVKQCGVPVPDIREKETHAMCTTVVSDNARLAASIGESSSGHTRPQDSGCMLWVRAWRLAMVAALGAAGCGTTRLSDTQRTATEQLLVSNA